MKSKATASWENKDYPILCSTCLGPNPYLRMTRERYGTDCKVCLKPYTTFRWCPAPKGRFRQTVLCQSCARIKNVCQSCITDIDYGLPVAVRDSVLGIKENPPTQEANREYYLAVNAAKLSRNDCTLLEYSKAVKPEDEERLKELSKLFKSKQQDQNLPAPCSFYAKGVCNRGDTCPFRHVLVTPNVPTLKSYREKYYGQDQTATPLISSLETNDKSIAERPLGIKPQKADGPGPVEEYSNEEDIFGTHVE